MGKSIRLPGLGVASFSAALVAASTAGCAHAPSPLVPSWQGSIGTPDEGCLTAGACLAADAEGLAWLRRDDRHWGLPRFVQAIQRAAATVARERPGAALRVGDLSARGGGHLSPHFSHRSGTDADLLLYVSTLDGAPVPSPGFVHFGPDGLARDPAHGRWLRLDVDREWRLVRALLQDPDARIQWIFVNDAVRATLLEWALARGESPEVVRRATEVMLQPHPGGLHDDHIHVRTACTAAEIAAGCEPMGPRRTWLPPAPPSPAPSDDDRRLALSLMTPLEEPVPAPPQVASPYAESWP
jgi:penicillin-insensitive murein endopeptidase